MNIPYAEIEDADDNEPVSACIFDVVDFQEME